MTEQHWLLIYIDEAITVMEKRYGRQPTPLEIQSYLYAEYHIVESLESVKRNGDIVFDLRNKEQESKE
ncbi:MAG TPA: hypothetical protein VFQ36_24275 [Ktedonobacteraceae bacterium]|nr:hypothetical protein [Ktedonobacteraceae bacterium]